MIQHPATFNVLLSVGVNIEGAATFSAVAAPGVVGGFGTGTLTTQSTTVRASGGLTPYVTYAWSQVSGGAASIVSAASQTTAFTATPGAGAVIVANFKCVVTDSAAATATTEEVVATFSNIS